MRGRHLLLALVIVVVWGLNFLFAKIALHAMPPLTLLSLRFVLTAVPAIFFVKRPRVSVGVLASYGLTMFALHFAFIFSGLRAGLAVGLASLIVQVQVFFTMGLSVWLLGERPHATRWLGALVAFAGIAVVATHTGGEVTPVGVILVILAAVSSAVGNIVAKRTAGANPISLVVWGNAVAIAPMLGLALVLDGPHTMVAAFGALTPAAMGALAYIVLASTFVGYSLWSFLLGRYSASTVVPFTLLVPVVAIIGSMLVFGERMPPWKLLAAALVVAGVALNVFGPRLARMSFRRVALSAPTAP